MRIKTLKLDLFIIPIFLCSLLINGTASSQDGEIKITELVEVFNTIQNTAFSGNSNGKLHKWNQGLGSYITGNSNDELKNLALLPFANIAKNTNVKLEPSLSYNVLWIIDPEPAAYISQNYKSSLLNKLGQNRLEILLEDSRISRCAGSINFDQNENIDFAVGVIDSDLSEAEIVKCSGMLLMRSMGFSVPISRKLNSVFSDNDDDIYTTYNDILMIRMIYSDDVKSGIDYSRFLSVMRNYLGDKTINIIENGE